MKNTFKVIAITVLVAVIGFSFIACDNGTGGGGPFNPGGQRPVDPLTAEYVYDDEENEYRLVITETVTGRAAYNPKKDDKYELTITYKADRTVKKTSRGTVASVTGVEITLTHNSETTVTVTVSSTGNTNTIISIYSESGKIPVDEGGDVDIPEALIPTNPGGEQPGGEQPVGTEGLAYELINNGTAYSVSAGTVTSGEVIIPATYNGLPVTEIGRSNYSYGAFYNTGITSVIIPESVTTIGWVAFYGCTSLTNITIPEGVTSIGSSAFSNCTSLTSITIPAGITSIGDFAFAVCRSLTSITIPASVTSIGRNAFSECTSLTSITVDGNNPYYASEGGILFNKAKTTLIRAPAGISGSVTIPAGVTSIGEKAFEGCTSLTSVTIPSSVTSIGNYAFYYCTGLTGITIPAGVTSIDQEAFRECTSLTGITIPASVTSIGYMAFLNWTAQQTINIQGKADRAATIAAGWDEWWDSQCNATIIYNAP